MPPPSHAPILGITTLGAHPHSNLGPWGHVFRTSLGMEEGAELGKMSVSSLSSFGELHTQCICLLP